MNISKLKVARPPGAVQARPVNPTSLRIVRDEPMKWEPKRLNPSDFPDQPLGQGAPPPTIDNVAHLLRENGVTARYNVIRKKYEVVIPGVSGVVDNEDSVSLAHIKSLMALHGMQTGEVRGIVEAIGSRHPHNPVSDWIKSKPWDGVDRLPAFYDTITTVPDYPVPLKKAIMYNWSLSAVAAAFMPSGFSTRIVLLMQGKQSIGKTRWCMSLVPDPALRASVVKTDHHFDGGNKDNLITAIRHWIVELGEVESSFRKDQERVKGILTRDRDVVRLPYAAAESEFPRRTVFLASANSSDFLSDTTGSTRWGVIAVDAIDYEHGIDMQQLFAQLAVDFEAGIKWWFDAEQEAELEAWNERHQATSIVREKVMAIIDFEGNDTDRKLKVTATEILVEAGIEYPTTTQARECGGLIRAKFGAPTKVRGVYRWELPIRPFFDPLIEQPKLELINGRPKDRFD